MDPKEIRRSDQKSIKDEPLSNGMLMKEKILKTENRSEISTHGEEKSGPCIIVNSPPRMEFLSHKPKECDVATNLNHINATDEFGDHKGSHT